MADVFSTAHHDIYPFISAQHGGALQNTQKGRTVLVTGGGKGLGAGIALHFALAGAGTVIISGRTASTLQQTQKLIEGKAPGCKVVVAVCDVSKDDEVAKLFSTFTAAPDVLINNAGKYHRANIADSDPLVWWSEWEVNVKGTYLCTRAYLRMLAGKPGVIVNVSSAASNMVVPEQSAYNISKVAMNYMTEYVTVGYPQVQCIAFHPGAIPTTDMGMSAPAEFKSYFLDNVDLGSGTAVYLSTPRANYLGGRYVDACWDMEKLEAIKDKIVNENWLVSRIQQPV